MEWGIVAYFASMIIAYTIGVRWAVRVVDQFFKEKQ